MAGMVFCCFMKSQEQSIGANLARFLTWDTPYFEAKIDIVNLY